MIRSQALSTSSEQFWVILFGIFVFANLADFLTTKSGIDLAGHGAELNPWLRLVMASFGVYALLALKTTACGLVWFFRQKISKGTLLKANIAFSALALSNAIQLTKFTP